MLKKLFYHFYCIFCLVSPIVCYSVKSIFKFQEYNIYSRFVLSSRKYSTSPRKIIFFPGLSPSPRSSRKSSTSPRNNRNKLHLNVGIGQRKLFESFIKTFFGFQEAPPNLRILTY